VQEGVVGIVGRELELGVLGEFAGTKQSGGALVLVGGAGVGKTTLWQAGVSVARERGWRVLVARPSGAEAELSFAALIDLCDGVELGLLENVPGPQLAALEVALLRAQPTAVPPEPHAIALGMLNALRALAAGAPVLVAIDDVQWLDRPSAEVLTFVARRLEGQGVSFMLAQRPGRPSELEHALERLGAMHVEVGALSLGATRRLLSERLGLSLSRGTLRRVVESTLGNPLFALELGRVLVERGMPGIGEEISVPDSVEDLLGTRVSALRPAVRLLLVAVALSGDLGMAELAALGSPAAVQDALDGEVLVVEGERVRASHPLLAAVARKHSQPRERRELHHALAGMVVDEELRALHLALATERPDEELATIVAAAAVGASVRGARQDAVQLATHALRLTAPGSPRRGARLLVLAGYLERAGELQRLTDLLEAELGSLPSGSIRGRAWLLLAEGAPIVSSDEYERHLDAALAESKDDPGLRAEVLAKKATDMTAACVLRIGEGEAWGLEALAACRGGGFELERRVLYALSWARALRGRPIDELCERFSAASEAPGYIAASPHRVASQRLAWRGKTASAREMMTGLWALADERGEPSSYALLRLHLCELELRVGDWDAASRLLEEWAESSERELLSLPMYERCRALLAAGRGLSGEAERWAAETITRAEAAGVGWDKLEAMRALGMGALLSHEPERAGESLGSVWEHTEREGVTEPGVFPVAPDLVEALTELGEHQAALAVTARVRELADQQQHPWGLVTAQRCAAVIQLASDVDHERAAEALALAADDYQRLGLSFDHARSLLSLGRAQRRVRKWGAARGSLEDAVAAFEQLGSGGWAEEARSELARVGARRPSPTGQLTPTEQRIAELAASGRSNKQIAQELYVTVHTVETHLSHAYAKLGVRSRTQLAGRLSVLG
jgi:DNA-binding NarL/FixJ family response regulator